MANLDFSHINNVHISESVIDKIGKYLISLPKMACPNVRQSLVDVFVKPDFENNRYKYFGYGESKFGSPMSKVYHLYNISHDKHVN